LFRKHLQSKTWLINFNYIMINCQEGFKITIGLTYFNLKFTWQLISSIIEIDWGGVPI